MNKKPSKETLEKWHKDPNNWIWGIFYFNKEDRRIFPSKKVPMMGWTINLANPLSVGLFLLIISAILFINYVLLR